MIPFNRIVNNQRSWFSLTTRSNGLDQGEKKQDHITISPFQSSKFHIWDANCSKNFSEEEGEGKLDKIGDTSRHHQQAMANWLNTSCF